MEGQELTLYLSLQLSSSLTLGIFSSIKVGKMYHYAQVLKSQSLFSIFLAIFSLLRTWVPPSQRWLGTEQRIQEIQGENLVSQNIIPIFSKS